MEKIIQVEEYLKFPLTPSQRACIERIEEFINGTNNCFLLKGYAGTGKTTLMKGIAHLLSMNRTPFALMAPTGRAARVISQKTGLPAYTIHKTIYSTNDVREYRIDNEDGTETFKFYFELTNSDDYENYVFLVDESSMISDVYSEGEFFRFGSGQLLSDLFKFVGFNRAKNHSKIVFIGDPAQLPPVNSKISPALNINYLSSLPHNIKVEEFEMQDIVRQEKDSGILRNATNIRGSINAGLYNKLDVSHNYQDVAEVKHKDLVDKYIEACADKIEDQTIIVAYSNSSVSNYNKAIREHFFPGQQQISKGDKIIVVQNNYMHEIALLNGEFGVIESISSEVESRNIPLKRKDGNIAVKIEFRDVIATFCDITGNNYKVPCKIIENLLNSKKPNLDSEETQALYVDFVKRNERFKPNTPEFKEALKSDPYFNALRIKYGYAVTCHKAQGGEWDNVFIDFRSNIDYFNEQYFRWAYTAITRGKTRVYTINAPHFGITAYIPLVGDSDLENLSSFITRV